MSEKTSEGALRIFSYTPNPRIFKASIVARLCDLEIDIRGSSVQDLAKWLWDFHARPLTTSEIKEDKDNARQSRIGFKGTLHKTEEFLKAHPFGTVPAAFSPDGSIGIFESNSIMRAVARLKKKPGPLYGTDPFSTSRIDSFLDVSLVFANQTQKYFMAVFGEMTPEVWNESEKAYITYVSGMEDALETSPFVAGNELTLADICLVCELCLCMMERKFMRELEKQGFQCILDERREREYPNVFTHFYRLVKTAAFEPDCGPYLASMRNE